MLKTTFFIVSVLASLVLYGMFRPPNIEVQQDADGVVLTNLFLGEYYLGFRQLVFKPENSNRVLCSYSPQSALSLRLKVRAGVDTLQTLNNKQGDLQPVTGAGPDCLLKPQVYRVEVWANNGFGSITKRTLLLDLSGQH